ncbi:aspartate carbamoyltransferase catalytic subunit [Victivallis vadensis]|uniref:Aspartate carbamoyltransferase n=1 Tax=Victivallis vadensis TaxID=172901 RepID=A0A2U1B9A6_9BACT|nr:aspartate carbamoyltransferase catalytic subunit [Victivallis vadensis]NMD88395.1 aspartate carbamoyltransferase catalytic subunit [Victivallis vadensis]PVY45250.1 aspartate carbamoyltransferase [Victivallis vadensis]PWM70945.1 MAG: aspartate carbamoyltransferase [Lentisphaerota bacterium]HJH02542.1 aspartate carbamoyltransferase catalytic subunit [Victivallis vadensis]
MEWTRKDLLSLYDLSAEEITFLLDTAEEFKKVSERNVKKVPALRGKTVVNLFVEPSTRTRVSFELAEQRLSADIVNMQASSSSLLKGETLLDTVRNIESLQVDLIVMRHSAPGAQAFIAKHLKCGVVNAGDGAHSHPTQALLDIFTMREKKGALKDLKVTIVGDILHSRVARSNMWGLLKLGAKVTLAGPSTLVPREFEAAGVRVCHNLKDAVQDADVVNLLRIQHERQSAGFFPSTGEYAKFFGLNRQNLRWMKPDVLVMHPGPINRDVELTSEVADGPNSVILEQVTNGLAVRMAVLFLVAGCVKK